MTFDRARFDKLSSAGQGLVLIALPFPLFLLFAIAGDLPRGTLVWAFSTALLNALYSCGAKGMQRILATSIAVLGAFHIVLIVWNPLRNFHLLGGLFVPIALVDYCVDYAVLWMILRTFKTSDP